MVIQNMAQSSKEKTNIEKSFPNCPPSILKAIPSQCEKVLFSDLKPGESYKDKAIVGKVHHLNKIGKRASGFIRKILVTDALENDAEDQMKLTIFLLDEFAQDSDVAEIGNYVIITNFSLEKSTHHNSNELPFQVLVKKDESQVLFGKKVQNTKSKSSSKQKSVKKKAQSDDPEQTNSKKRKSLNEEEVNVLSNHYEYTALGELQESASNQTFNVYGIVEKCDLKVLQGKGTQILDLVLTDQTETGFVCSIFSSKDDVFPDIYPGDIIRVHRMQVYKFRSMLKGKCFSPRYILVFAKKFKGDKPKTVAKSFTYCEEDSARVRGLFEWYDKKNEPKLICELNRGDYANIVCQVIGVYCAKTTEAVILKIWDGTKTNQFESSHYGFPEEIIDEKLFLIARNFYVVLSVYGHHCTVAAELRPGQFIEVKDAHLFSPKTNPDDSKLCLHAGSKEERGIQVLNSDDERVQLLQRRLETIASEYPEVANQTDDILSQNNSVFLNCDISAFTSSQQCSQKEVADLEMLNRPLNVINEDTSVQQNKTVVSVSEAVIKPGQSTQEFSAIIELSQELNEAAISSQNIIPPSNEPDPVLNKTPLEFKRFLHEPEKDLTSKFTSASQEIFTQSSDTSPAISEVGEYSRVKPSSIAEVILHDTPFKFRILCAVMSYKPDTTSLYKLIHLYCPICLYITEDASPSISPFEERDGLFYFYCPECSIKEVDKQNWPILVYTFVVSFYLHDGTQSSAFEVFLWGENAVQFFKGVTAEQALRDQSVSNSILEMLWSICPNCRPYDSSAVNENSFKPYPMLDCCVLSYKSQNKTLYQIFDTKLK